MQHSEFLLAQRPGVVNARGAKQWLKDLPLTDARAAHHCVAALVAELEHAPMTARDRLEILETMRGHVFDINEAYAARYAAKPLPLGLAERNALAHALALWRHLAAVYMQCVEASLGAEYDLAPRRALCLARAIGCLCEAIKDQARAGQADDPRMIDDLQRILEVADEQNALHAPVRDSRHPRGQTSVAATYRRVLLIRLVAGFAGGRDRESMFELAQMWESKTALSWSGQSAAGDPLPSPAGDKRLVRSLRMGRWLHLLDVTRLARSLQRRLRKLAAGAPIDELNLPATMRHPGVAGLLARLHEHWCVGANQRAHPREAAGQGGTQPVRLCPGVAGFDGMYLLIEGHALAVNAADALTSRRRFDELFVFQHTGRARFDEPTKMTAGHFETWQITDRGTDGFRLRRPQGGARFRCGQVVAMRPSLDGSAGTPVMAEIRWLAEPDLTDGVTQPGALDAGIEVLPGKPYGVALRGAGLNTPADAPYEAAFRLGELHGAAHLSIVTPPGWFKPGRLVEMKEAETVCTLRLDGLVRRGLDFELIDAVLAR